MDFDFGSLGSIFGGCASCGAREKDLRPWPPNNPKAPKYCSLCCLKKSVEFAGKQKQTA